MGALDDVDSRRSPLEPAGTAPVRSGRRSHLCSPVRMSRSRTRPFSSPMTNDPSPRATGEVLRTVLKVESMGTSGVFHRTFSGGLPDGSKRKPAALARVYGHEWAGWGSPIRAALSIIAAAGCSAGPAGKSGYSGGATPCLEATEEGHRTARPEIVEAEVPQTTWPQVASAGRRSRLRPKTLSWPRKRRTGSCSTAFGPRPAWSAAGGDLEQRPVLFEQ